MNGFGGFISTHILGKPRLSLDVSEFEPFLINRGQILKNRKIVFYTFNGMALIFAVTFGDFGHFRKNLHAVYIPRELPVELGSFVCTVTAVNTGRSVIDGAVIDVASYSSFIQRESTPNIREIFFSGFPTEGFECRLRLNALEPGEFSRFVFSLGQAGVKSARYSYDRNRPGTHITRSHYYIRPIERDLHLLMLDKEKIRLPEITDQGSSAHLLHSTHRYWEKLKI